MATNNITSGKAPRRRGTSPIREAGIPVFINDPIFEKNTGVAGRLASVQAQPVAGISAATTDDLLRRAGVSARRGRTAS